MTFFTRFSLFCGIIASGFVISPAFAESQVVIPTEYFVNSGAQITYFYGNGCPHCAKVAAYTDDRFFSISLDKKEVYYNRQNAQEFQKVGQALGVPLDQLGVPLFVISVEKKQFLIGDEPIIQYMKHYETGQKPSLWSRITQKIQSFWHSLWSPAEAHAQEIETNESGSALWGAVQKEAQAQNVLNIGTVTAAALVDAINPCAFSVLILLMASMMLAGERRRALAAGLLFSAAIFLSYYAMGVGLYQALATVSSTIMLQKFFATLALIVGLLNLKDYFWYGKGFLMEVPISWRPTMKRLIKGITTPSGAFVIGILISLFLLPCTSGPYIVIIGLLGQEEMFTAALGWLGYYNFIFVLPMIVLTFGVYFGLSPERLEKIRMKNLRLLHLISGLLMIGIAVSVFLS